jgi:hypothetical protein
MSQIPEENIPESYYAAFYKSIIKGLSSGNVSIVHAILLNSSNLFTFPLPGIHILVPFFIEAIEKEVLTAYTHAPFFLSNRSCFIAAKLFWYKAFIKSIQELCYDLGLTCAIVESFKECDNPF